KRVLKQCELELRELRLAVETGQEPEVVIREAADVANFALIVADLYAKAPASEIFPSASGGGRCAGPDPDQVPKSDTNSCTGICSSRACSLQAPSTRSTDCGESRVRRFFSNLASSNGIPSERRRRWPIGY